MIKKFKRVGTLLLSSLLVVALLAGCGKATQTSKTEEKQERQSLTVGISDGSVRTALVILADKLGYFNDQGLDVELVRMPNAADGVNAVNLGKLDVYTLAIIPSLSTIAKRGNVKIIGGTGSEGSSIVALDARAEEFKDLKNFKGKKVGVTRLNTSDIVTRSKVKEAGIDPKTDVEYVELDSYASIIEALKKKTVDVGVVINDFAIRAKAQGISTVYPIGKLAPDYVCCRQTANIDVIKNKRSALVKLQKAQLLAHKYLIENQQESIRLLSEFSGQTEDFVYQSMFAPDSTSPVSADPNLKNIKAFYSLLEDGEYIPKGVDVSEYVDTSIYKDALEDLIKKNPTDKVYLDLNDKFKASNL